MRSGAAHAAAPWRRREHSAMPERVYPEAFRAGEHQCQKCNGRLVETRGSAATRKDSLVQVDGRRGYGSINSNCSFGSNLIEGKISLQQLAHKILSG